MSQHPLWCLHERILVTLPQQPVHPASPILLTSTGPLMARCFVFNILLNNTKLRVGLKFETETRRRTAPWLRIIHSTLPNTRSHCYPEGYFRGNQLLSVSMSLSPLCPAPTSDLHVSTVRGLPPEFPLASTTPSKDRRFSGLRL